MSRPLLVGELNPYGSDPEYALYPHPKGSAGHRLATLVMGLGRRDYLARFDRVNLCVDRWSLPKARAVADLLVERRPAPFVLLGAKVCEAFGKVYAPFLIYRFENGAGPVYAVTLPHPSGRCREWHRAGAVDRARAVLREAGLLEAAA